MKWLLKAIAQKAISILPYPENINYLFQSKVTKTLPMEKERFLLRVGYGVSHFKSIRKHDPEIARLRGYEFGAGWDLIIPLTYYALGIEDQTLVDIRSNLRFELVNDTVRRLNEYRTEIEEAHGVRLRALDSRPIATFRDLSLRYGITYLAPRDATATSLKADSFDFITSTYTLEHIPRSTINLILLECSRLLKPSGLVSSLIDMRDHYSGFDSHVSVYNYLQFPTWTWWMVNSSLHYQNRLRHSDYVDMATELGFQTVEEWVDRPTEKDLASLRSLRLAPEFAHYSEAALAAKRLGLVMERN